MHRNAQFLTQWKQPFRLTLEIIPARINTSYHRKKWRQRVTSAHTHIPLKMAARCSLKIREQFLFSFQDSASRKTIFLQVIMLIGWPKYRSQYNMYNICTLFQPEWVILSLGFCFACTRFSKQIFYNTIITYGCFYMYRQHRAKCPFVRFINTRVGQPYHIIYRQSECWPCRIILIRFATTVNLHIIRFYPWLIHDNFKFQDHYALKPSNCTVYRGLISTQVCLI